MDPQEAHARAQQAFGGVLGRVTAAQLHLPTPCTEWDVAQVVTHVVTGNTFVATGVRVPFEGDPMAAYPASAAAAAAAFASSEGMARTYRVRTGDVPATEYVGMRATDLMAHAWDLATATGQSTDLDPELAEELLVLARKRPQYAHRGPQSPVGPEQPCPPARPAADRLAAFLGRPVDTPAVTPDAR